MNTYILLIIISFIIATLSFDSIIKKKKSFSPQYQNWLKNTQWLLFVFILYPFASLAVNDSITNYILDLTSYILIVTSVSLIGGVRLSIIINFKKEKQILNLLIFSIVLITYFTITGTQLIAKYNAYSIKWMDFGFEYPTIWQSFRYAPFRMIDFFSSKETTVLAYHWPLIYIFFAPLSLIWDNPRLVLLLSTLFFVLSAIAVYKLAEFNWKNRPLAIWIGTIFLLYLPVNLANLYNFHADPLAMPFILFSFLFAQRKNWRRYYIMLFFAILCKEYVGLVFLGFGAWLIIEEKEIKHGFISSSIGLLWFLFVVKIGIPFFNNNQAPMVLSLNYSYLGGDKGLSGILLYAISHPSIFLKKIFAVNNISAMFFIMLPLLFIPLLRVDILFFGSLIILKNLLSLSGIRLELHRETLWIPFILFAFIHAMKPILKKTNKRIIIFSITFSTFITFALQGHLFPTRGFWLEKNLYIKSDHDKICDELIKKIPKNESIMSSNHISPVFMNRKYYYLFSCPLCVKPNYILIDTTEIMKSFEKNMDNFECLLNNNTDYDLLENKDGLFLFKKKNK